MKRVFKASNNFLTYGILIIFLLLCTNCKKESDIETLDIIRANEGICIYPVKSMLVKYPQDTVFRSVEQLGEEPYIKYNDIISYDTVFHIIKLKYSISQLKRKLDMDNLRFAVTLNGEILYSGNFVYNSANMPSDEPVIFLDEKLDTLAFNEIRIYRKFPVSGSDYYNDLRYQPELNKRLKSDNKAFGSLFSTPYNNNTDLKNGVEFYYIEGLEGYPSFSRADIINYNIDISKIKLAESPFISYSQIAFYDSANNIFYLRQPADFSNYTYQQVIEKFYAITVNGNPVLIGGFYLILYSEPCPFIHIFPDQHYKNPINNYLLPLYPGYETKNPACSVINSPQLIQRLMQDGKIKNNFVI